MPLNLTYQTVDEFEPAVPRHSILASAHSNPAAENDQDELRISPRVVSCLATALGPFVEARRAVATALLETFRPGAET
jgi:hypothetical protein